jgi:hypothetical protein
VGGSTDVVNIMLEGWMKRFGGGIEFEPDIDELIMKALDHIDEKRRELNLTEYDAKRYGTSGDRILEELFEDIDEAAIGLYSVQQERVKSEV